MELSSSHFLDCVASKNTNELSPHQCSCEKYKLLMRCSDLTDPTNSWLKSMIVPCGHKRACSCDLVIAIPYGYFFPVNPELELGDTIGPNSTYVRIISNDGFRFVLKRKLMKNCLLIDSWFKNENQTESGQEAEIFIKKYPSICVYYLCLFLIYKNDYETGSTLPGKDFTVPDQLVFQMLEMAHDFML